MDEQGEPLAERETRTETSDKEPPQDTNALAASRDRLGFGDGAEAPDIKVSQETALHELARIIDDNIDTTRKHE